MFKTITRISVFKFLFFINSQRPETNSSLLTKCSSKKHITEIFSFGEFDNSLNNNLPKSDLSSCASSKSISERQSFISFTELIFESNLFKAVFNSNGLSCLKPELKCYLAFPQNAFSIC